jgi:hypothetical protein
LLNVISPLWIDSDNYAIEYNRKYFVNGAGICLYLATQTNVDCFAALVMTALGYQSERGVSDRLSPKPPGHCDRSEAISLKQRQPGRTRLLRCARNDRLGQGPLFPLTKYA